MSSLGATRDQQVARVVVVGLGPAGPDLLTSAAREAIERAPQRYLRTNRHPSATAVAGATSFDSLYDSATSLDEVYAGIVEALVAAADEHGEVLYAVPGSPLVAERAVELLLSDARVVTEVVPSLSFTDLVWARLGVDPLAASVRLVDAHRFAVEAAGERGPLLVAQCDDRAVLSEMKLAVDAAGSTALELSPVTVLQRLGLADEAVFEVAWDELDRAFAPDHLTCVWVPELAAPVGVELVRFAELVRTLRARCPWDREQTHASLTRHLLEETYEVLEAIAGLPASMGHLEEELGDLLFQVVFHATLAAEEGAFDLADVARGVHDKLVHRHPHVFGGVEADTADAVMTNWERIKQAEKGRESVMDGIPADLPSLLYAHKVQRKAASMGFDRDSTEGAYPRVAEGLDHVRSAPTSEVDAVVGDLLFAVVRLARHHKVDPEAALRAATARFRDRFVAEERAATLEDDGVV